MSSTGHLKQKRRLHALKDYHQIGYQHAGYLHEATQIKKDREPPDDSMPKISCSEAQHDDSKTKYAKSSEEVPTTRPMAATPKRTCGICFEDVAESNKQFGLLSSCDHSFCLNCVLKWRQSKTIKKDVTQSCPACRLKSKFVIPSKTFYVGTEKEKTFSFYLSSHLASTSQSKPLCVDEKNACRDFDQNECVYENYDDSFSELYDTPVRRMLMWCGCGAIGESPFFRNSSLLHKDWVAWKPTIPHC